MELLATSLLCLSVALAAALTTHALVARKYEQITREQFDWRLTLALWFGAILANISNTVERSPIAFTLGLVLNILVIATSVRSIVRNILVRRRRKLEQGSPDE
ncbi:hypothetical protein [Psychromicrobium lacuslunae]|nr:hypothetical protein [Psychromicrobium lacuslunae]